MFGSSWKILQMALAGAALSAAGITGALAQSQPVGSWVMKAPLPAALAEVGVVYVDDKVHVIGGSVLGYTGPYHEEYDPATTRTARTPRSSMIPSSIPGASWRR